MSLKAYEGLMTRKGLKYVQDETIKRIHMKERKEKNYKKKKKKKKILKFSEAGENQLLKKYVEMVLEFIDYDVSAEHIFKFNGFGLDRFTEKEYNEIKIEK